MMDLKCKVVDLKKLVFQRGVGILIPGILDYGQCHLKDFLKFLSLELFYFWIFRLAQH